MGVQNTTISFLFLIYSRQFYNILNVFIGMKKAIITGASSGLGYEIASNLIEKGVVVVNVSRTESDLKLTNIKADLSNSNDIVNAIELIKKEHSDFDVLILNSGIMPLAEIGKTDFDIDHMFRVNVTGSIKLVDGLIDNIKKNKGDILVVGSTASFRCSLAHGVYSSSKHAVLGYIRALQTELKDDNVRVIGVHPGGFNSNLRGRGVLKEGYMNPKDLAKFMVTILELPKGIQISEVVIDRNKGAFL